MGAPAHSPKRRSALIAATSAATLAAVPAWAQTAQAPGGNVSIVVPFGPGSTPDIVARLIAEPFGKRIARNVIVDNRPGASGNIGSRLVAVGPADGSLLLMTAFAFVVAPLLYRKLPFHPVNDFTPISFIGSGSMILVTHKGGPRTCEEFVSVARAAPGKLDFGSTGIGAPHHMSMALFEQIADIDLTHVPYKAVGDLVAGLIGGQVIAAWLPISVALPQVQGGRLNALANSHSRRSPILPEVRTAQEIGFSAYEVDNWVGLVAPARLPEATVTLFADEVDRIIKDATVTAKLQAQGVAVESKSRAQFAAFLAAERKKWEPLIAARKLGLND
ncbi:MAG: tripartite tricarboxylate transporter substrate binding protein [Proteobacteria bacterium]|nr:tripartite tricarboxylate transporter substrate binding protein [Burkholderiales bacterium]